MHHDRPYYGSIVLAVILLPTMLNASQSNNYDFWIEHSAFKVMKGSPRPANARVAADLASARNEWESFQLVLRANSDLRNVRVRVSDLTGIKGSITASNISLYRVGYLRIPDGWPDPLLPLTAFSLKRGETQPLFVTVKVPGSVAPGGYRGSLTVAADGIRPRTVSVRLHVWDFVLPVAPKCKTLFGMTIDYVAEKQGIAYPSAEAYELHKKCYEFLLDHKISSEFIPTFVRNPPIPNMIRLPEYWTEEARKYLEDPRMTSYRIPYWEKDDDYHNLGDMVHWLIDNDYFRKGYFEVADEPL